MDLTKTSIKVQIKNKEDFALSPGWMFESPIDFEYKKYKILSFFKKTNKLIDEKKLFPTLMKLNFLFLNSLTILKEYRIYDFRKKLSRIDDEILFSNLISVLPPIINNEEKEEIIKITAYFIEKIVFLLERSKGLELEAREKVKLKVIKNSENIRFSEGFINFFNGIKEETLKYKINKKYQMELINFKPKRTVSKKPKEILKRYNNSVKNFSLLNGLPLIELLNEDNLPLDETFLPIAKRKIIGLVYPEIKLLNSF